MTLREQCEWLLDSIEHNEAITDEERERQLRLALSALNRINCGIKWV